MLTVLYGNGLLNRLGAAIQKNECPHPLPAKKISITAYQLSLANQQHLQAFQRSGRIKQEVQAPPYGRDFFVFADIRLIIAALRVIGSTDLVERQKCRHWCIHLASS